MRGHYSRPQPGQVGVIYLIHFDRPLRNGAQHYYGWTTNLHRRLWAHRNRDTTWVMSAVRNDGIPWTLARTWEGTRDDERRLHRGGNGRRRCPLCRVDRLIENL